jgi:hypothetical protein
MAILDRQEVAKKIIFGEGVGPIFSSAGTQKLAIWWRGGAYSDSTISKYTNYVGKGF